MVPSFIKKVVSKNPRLANYLKAEYDRFMESPDDPGTMGKKRLDVLLEIQKNIKLSVGEKIAANVDGCRFFIKPGASGTSILLADALYENEETRFVKEKIKPTDIVFDAGANFGWYAIHFSKWAARVISFEPIPATFEELQANIALNQCANVEAINQAVGDKVGDVDFYVPQTRGGSAIASEHNYFGDKVSVKMTTLDDFVASRGIHPDFIKVDIEGGELSFLKGGIKTLAQYHPDLFMEIEERHAERFGYLPEDIFSFLAKLGYQRTQVRPIMFYFHI
jgi:FkbM family methyltransferase